jgi:GNAT superfamily N-acetyltransferase
MLSIRPAERADLPVIKTMMREFVDHLNAIDPDDPSDISDAQIARIEDLILGRDAPCRTILCEWNGEPAGYLTYFWGMAMEGTGFALFVGDLYVTKRARRAGVGRALMQESRRIAEERGALQIFWTVWRKNTGAIRFYEALGARPYAEEILMEWLGEAD